jgi:UDP-N-acetylmuramyl pentapeptide synthase
MAANRVLRAGTNQDALQAVLAITRTSPRTPTMQQGSWTVLVKGSRGMRMEEIVHGLRGAV